MKFNKHNDTHDKDRSPGGESREPNECEASNAAQRKDGEPDVEGAAEAEQANGEVYAQKYNEILDRYQRTMAEFDNFRKRTVKEKATIYDDGVRDVIEKLLPVIDNFERALNANENKEDGFYQGVVMIARQLGSFLTEWGVELIEGSEGVPFDHNLHFAVAHIEDDQYDTNTIVEELQKGYKHKDKVIRPSMVKVAN